MNILIASCGTRNKIVQYFKQALRGRGKVVATDCSPNAPALYEADVHYIVPRITEENYLETQEGKNLPVTHCVRGSKGWELNPRIEALCEEKPIDKPTFGSKELGRKLQNMDEEYRLRGMGGLESITFVGLCTDICVISNAMIAKAFLPEVPVIVDAACCAGVTPESHSNALEAMKMCQIICE